LKNNLQIELNSPVNSIQTLIKSKNRGDIDGFDGFDKLVKVTTKHGNSYYTKQIVVTASVNNVSFGEPVPVGSIFTIKSSLAIFYGPEKPHDLHEYAAPASLQLPHLQINSALHSGQLNLTFLSPGMICLLLPLHIGSEILEDILKSTLLGIYTFLGILGFTFDKSLNFSSN